MSTVLVSDPVIASVPVGTAWQLAQLFQRIANIAYGVLYDAMFGMKSVPLPDAAEVLVDGQPLRPVWYSATLSGASGGVKWCLHDPAALLGQSIEMEPYPGLRLAAKWGWVLPPGVPMPVQGWTVMATMAMERDTTLETVGKHLKVILAFDEVDRTPCTLGDYHGVLATLRARTP